MRGGDGAVRWEGIRWVRIDFKSVFSQRCRRAPEFHAKNTARPPHRNRVLPWWGSAASWIQRIISLPSHLAAAESLEEAATAITERLKTDFESFPYCGNSETDFDNGDACAVYILPCSHDLREFSMLKQSKLPGFLTLFVPDQTECT